MNAVGRLSKLVIIALGLWAATACDSLLASDELPPGTSAELMPMSVFTAPENLETQVPLLSGRLHLPETKLEVFQVLQDDFRLTDRAALKVATLPKMAFNVFRDGNMLFPFARGRQLKLHPFWDVTLEPGHVWDVLDDRLTTYAVLPISLHEVNEDCTFHGLLKFSLKTSSEAKLIGSQETELIFQSAGETCLYLKLNMAGQFDIEYEAVSTAIRGDSPWAESASPLSALASRFSGFNPEVFEPSESFGSQDLTATGVVFDGRHYVGSCPTRAGVHPNCGALNLPSYSLAKTLVGTLALLQLEHLYDGAMNAKIADYVPECSQDLGWGDVTFSDALNMTTGHYLSDVANEDETSADMTRFYIAATHREKIRVACEAFPRKAPPGTKFIYRSSDFYVLGAALQSFYQAKVGSGRDFFDDLIVTNIFEPLGLSPAAQQTTRTADDISQSVTYNGLSLLRSDIAKIGHWLVTGEGRLAGQQILDPDGFASAMQRDPKDRGAVADRVLRGRAEDTYRYKNGLWAFNVASTVGCEKDSWVPFMSGVSGNVVLLFPNGTVYYHFSDNGHFSTSHIIPELHKLKSVCEENLT